MTSIFCELWHVACQGFGDSINALYTALRQSFSLGRLFLIDWTVNVETYRGDSVDIPLWSIGMEAPFQWDLEEVRHAG